MGLETYRRKRDFRRTPEPRGRSRKGRARGRSYVVQKHDASRLHHDLRLELDGVLKSRAVPKTPPTEPGEKVLAVQVEDHPLEYGGFEGVIAEGEYGGGTVMLWGRGTWEPEGDARSGLQRGKLTFRVRGERLRGRWSLVRMAPSRRRARERRSKGDEWLLIKRSDPEPAALEWERPERSVLSGRTMEEIAAQGDREWTSEGERPRQGAAGAGAGGGELDLEPALGEVRGARRARMPRELAPQLATLVDEAPAGDAWLHEIKHDGYRLLAFKQGGRVRLVTRRGQDWTDRFPRVASAVARLSIEDAIVDGEVVVLARDGTSDFQALQGSLGRADAPHVSRSPSARSASDGARVAGVRLSHPERVLWPEMGLTKRELAEYYAAVAEHVLPQVVGRPLTLVRCPRGRGKECFYQKHLGQALAEPLRGVELEEPGGTELYVAVDDLAGLVTLVQLGVLEIHPWGSRADRLDRPDRIVFDIDPAEDVGWPDVLATARVLRERLEALGLASFARTTGGKGLHVVVPIERRSTGPRSRASRTSWRAPSRARRRNATFRPMRRRLPSLPMPPRSARGVGKPVPAVGKTATAPLAARRRRADPRARLARSAARAPSRGAARSVSGSRRSSSRSGSRLRSSRRSWRRSSPGGPARWSARRSTPRWPCDPPPHDRPAPRSRPAAHRTAGRPRRWTRRRPPESTGCLGPRAPRRAAPPRPRPGRGRAGSCLVRPSRDILRAGVEAVKRGVGRAATAVRRAAGSCHRVQGRERSGPGRESAAIASLARPRVRPIRTWRRSTEAGRSPWCWSRYSSAPPRTSCRTGS